MKLIHTLLLSGLCLLSTACKKDNRPALNLVGKWQLRQTIQNEAMGGKWKNIQSESEIEAIEFRADGTYQSSLKTDLNRYTLNTDRREVTITSPAGNRYVYLYKLDSKYLELSELEPNQCIEGCASRYIPR